MIVGLLRQLILKLASKYISNIDINSIGLWSGDTILQNVSLNCRALTQTLNNPFVMITQGEIAELELRVPWSNLTSTPVQLKLSQVLVEVHLAPNEVIPTELSEEKTKEESLLARVLANIQLEIHDLQLTFKTTMQSYYVGQINVKELNIGNEFGAFINPYAQVSGVSKYNLSKKILVSGGSCRMIAGNPDHPISPVIIMHKFEKTRCDGCPLCYGFKESQYYTLLSTANLSFSVLVISESQESSMNKNYLKVLKVSEKLHMTVDFSQSLLTLKLNLVDDVRIVQDLYEVTELIVKSPEKHAAQQGWIRRGASWLFSYVGWGNNRKVVDRLFSSSTILLFECMALKLKVKLYNPSDFQIVTLTISTNNIRSSTSISTTESSEQIFPQHSAMLTSGEISHLVVSTCIKKDYHIIQSSQVKFTKIDRGIEFVANDFLNRVIMHKGDGSVRTSRTSTINGSIHFESDILLHMDSSSLLMDCSLEELTVVIQSILQTKGFYYRLMNGFNSQSRESIHCILHSHENQIKSEYSDKASVFENTIGALKEHATMLSDRLNEAEEEIRGLRQALANIAGPGGLAGILKIEPKDILCISEEGLVDGLPVSVILTNESCFVVSKEGRITDKKLISEMERLEERRNEIRIFSQDSFMKFNLSNVETFASALKALFNN